MRSIHALLRCTLLAVAMSTTSLLAQTTHRGAGPERSRLRHAGLRFLAEHAAGAISLACARLWAITACPWI